MKKLTFSIFAATLAFGANADVESVDAAVASRCTYDGFFFGLGVSAVDAGVKTETTDAQKKPFVEKSGAQAASFGNYALIKGAKGLDTNDHDTRFTANAVLGYGRKIKEKAYIALEAGLDAGQNSNFAHAGICTIDGKSYEVFSKNNGLIPSAALRLGYIHPETKTMVYLKAGAAYSQAKTTYNEAFLNDRDEDGATLDTVDDPYRDFSYDGKCSKWTPIVALGFEKVTGKNFRTRAEVEYRFQTTRSFDFDNTSLRDETPKGGKDVYPDYYKGAVKIYNKAAVTLRIMGIYTVK